MHHRNVVRIYDKILTEKELFLIVSNFDMSLEDFMIKQKIDHSEQYFKLLSNAFVNVYELMRKFKFKKNHICLNNIFFRDSDIILGGWNLSGVGLEFFPSGLGHHYFRAKAIKRKQRLRHRKVRCLVNGSVSLFNLFREYSVQSSGAGRSVKRN